MEILDKEETPEVEKRRLAAKAAFKKHWLRHL